MIENSEIKLLDCTLRDGGYYNNWNFSKSIIQKYVNCISTTGIKHIELGFRFNDYKKIKGLTAYTDSKLLNTLKIPTNLKVGIMINASDLIKKNKFQINILKKLISKNNINKVSFVRLACHFNEVFFLEKCFEYLKKLRLKIFVNIMQISEINTTKLTRIGYFLKNKKIKNIYLADSLGSLNPKKLNIIINRLKKICECEIGIHAHNNLNFALKNSISAINNGAVWIDSTITGMGRGPGNLKTEDIIEKCSNYQSSKKFKNLKNYFTKLKQNYKWGTNKYYIFAAKNKIHPTYIQTLLKDKRYGKKEILSILRSLSKSDAKKFNPSKLINLSYFINNNKFKGKWFPEKIFKNKDIIILGPGNNLKRNKLKIENKIIKENLYVISLNTFSTVSEKLINLRVMCHPLRIMSDKKKLNNLKTDIIMPFSSLQKKIRNNLKIRKKIYDFGILLNENNKLLVKDNYCILPYPLAVGYAISIAVSGKAKTIKLAGFDGYDRSDPEIDNTEQLLEQFKNKILKKKIISLTKTKYRSIIYKKL